MSASGSEPVVGGLLVRRAGGGIPAPVVARAVGPVVAAWWSRDVPGDDGWIISPQVSVATPRSDPVMDAEVLTPGSWGVGGAEAAACEAGPWRWGGKDMVSKWRMRVFGLPGSSKQKHVMWDAKITPMI